MPAWASKHFESVAPASPQVGRLNDRATSAWAASTRLFSGAPNAISAVLMSRIPALPLMATGHPFLRSWAIVRWMSDSAVIRVIVPASVTGPVAPGWTVEPGSCGINQSAATKIRSMTSSGKKSGAMASGYAMVNGFFLKLSRPPAITAAIS